jgi:hypothetical protein
MKQFLKWINNMFPDWEYGEPFLMSDSLYYARYYQWKRCRRTKRCELIRIPGQSLMGTPLNHDNQYAYPGVMPDGVAFDDKPQRLVETINLN